MKNRKQRLKWAALKFKDDFIVKTLLPKVKIKEKITEDLFKTQESPNIPSQFRFSGMKNVLILGYGMEGEVSKKYIEKNYPDLRILCSFAMSLIWRKLMGLKGQGM